MTAFRKCLICSLTNPVDCLNTYISKECLGFLKSKIVDLEILIVEAVRHKVDQIRYHRLSPFGFQKLYFHDIEYAEAQNKRVVFYLRGDKVVETSEPLRSFEERLTVSSGFFKCHRSYLVYLPNVDHFNNNEIFTKSGRSIPIARGYGKAFQEAYFAHMFQEE